MMKAIEEIYLGGKGNVKRGAISKQSKTVPNAKGASSKNNTKYQNSSTGIDTVHKNDSTAKSD